MEVPMSTENPTPHQCACLTCQAGNDLVLVGYHQQINLFLSRLNEPQRRWYVGSLSQAPDAPSDVQLALITGLDEKTIRRGRQELQAQLSTVPNGRLRKEGGGQLSKEKKHRR
jgi:hypothetical protein